MIIICGNEKGGVGKSTTAINLAVWLQRKNKSVILLDADKQENVKDWCEDRDENHEEHSIPCIQKLGKITKTQSDIDKHYDYVVTDVGGRDSYEFRTGLLSAHLCVLPFKCSQFDINTLEKNEEILDLAKTFNKGLTNVSYLNMCSANPKVDEVEKSTRAFDDFDSLQLIPPFVIDRKIYRDVLPDGRSIFEANNKLAIDEMNKLFEYINII